METTPVNVTEIVGSITGMLGDFSVSNLFVIIGGALGITVALVIAWFGYRYISRKLMGALKKGKLG